MSNESPKKPVANKVKSSTAEPSNFLRQIIEHDLAQPIYQQRPLHNDADGNALPPLITRFPPEPNGYLHIGHAKSICLNFGLAVEYQARAGGARCNMRLDDTNPVKEDVEYVDSILDAVRWLGFDWVVNGQTHLHYASDYFAQLYQFAEILIEHGKAYVDSQTADEIHAKRGNFNQAGQNSPYRERSVAENLQLFRAMRAGEFNDGQHVLRLKIDMQHPNIVMRDPVIYRIRHAHHHRTGDQWCIYPLYDFTHCISDALEFVSHSICTLEFENNRPLYDWILNALKEAGVFSDPLPHQHEFARLNLTYTLTSKRKLLQLVEEKCVDGWDDPRMPTIVGIRRRGYTPESLQLFAERIGVTKSDSWIDYSTLEGCLREELENKAHRAMAVLDPLKLTLTNWADVFGNTDHLEPCSLPSLPPLNGVESTAAKRQFKLGNQVWIEREDFEETPPKGYKRLYPGNIVRLKGGYVIECTGCERDEAGKIQQVFAKVIPGTKSGTPGSDSVKAKAAITWVAVADGVEAQVRLYDRLFNQAQPDAGGRNFLESINPDSLKTVKAYVEPSLLSARPDQKFQFERHGYFVADRKDHQPGRPVFNRTVSLKDSWGK